MKCRQLIAKNNVNFFRIDRFYYNVLKLFFEERMSIKVKYK